MLRVKGELDACRLKPVPCDGYVDNDALRFGVGLAGLISKAWASPCLRRDVLPFPGAGSDPITLHRVSSTENEADIMTNLSAVRHRELCRKDFDLVAVPEASVMTQAVLCLHAGWQSLSTPEADFSCSCATVQLLTKLADV